MHPSLSVRSNLVLAAVETTGAALIFLIGSPHPIPNLILGLALGPVAGWMQRQAIETAPDYFLSAETMLEVRRGLTSTRWGRWYLVWFWMRAALNLGLALALYREPVQILSAFICGYLAFSAARELTALPALRELERRSSSV